MNKLKKVLALLLALVMAFSLCACGKKNTAPKETAAPAAEAVEKAEASKDNAGENTGAAEGEKAPAKETEKPTEAEKPATEDLIKEGSTVGIVETGESDELENSGDYVAPPQEDVPAGDTSNDEPVTINMDIYDITYDMYLAMSAAEQQAVIALFGSTEDFMVWLNYVKAEYEAEHPAIEVGPGGVVDLD